MVKLPLLSTSIECVLQLLLSHIPHFHLPKESLRTGRQIHFEREAEHLLVAILQEIDRSLKFAFQNVFSYRLTFQVPSSQQRPGQCDRKCERRPAGICGLASGPSEHLRPRFWKLGLSDKSWNSGIPFLKFFLFFLSIISISWSIPWLSKNDAGKYE